MHRRTNLGFPMHVLEEINRVLTILHAYTFTFICISSDMLN